MSSLIPTLRPSLGSSRALSLNPKQQVLAGLGYFGLFGVLRVWPSVSWFGPGLGLDKPTESRHFTTPWAASPEVSGFPVCVKASQGRL